MKRIFIAADISFEARERAAGYLTQLREDDGYKRIRPVRPENLHITLKFLGNVDDSLLPAVARIADKAAAVCTRFTIEIGGAGVFGSSRDSRVMWLGIKDPGENLVRIARAIDDGCAEIGFPPPKGKLKPHLTIARLRNPGMFDDLIQIHLMNKFEPVTCSISEIVVYESQLASPGAIYSVVSRHPFPDVPSSD